MTCHDHLQVCVSDNFWPVTRADESCCQQFALLNLTPHIVCGYQESQHLCWQYCAPTALSHASAERSHPSTGASHADESLQHSVILSRHCVITQWRCDTCHAWRHSVTHHGTLQKLLTCKQTNSHIKHDLNLSGECKSYILISFNNNL